MTNSKPKTYLVGVIERAISYYEVEATDARTAAENWQDGEFYDRDDEALDSDGPCNVRERQADGRLKLLPSSQWEPAITDSEDERLRKAAPALLAALADVIDYAESEVYSLEQHVDSPEAEAEAERACKAVKAAREILAQATAGTL